MHTVMPLFDRDLMLVTDESTENDAKDWPKLIWILDMRDETNPVSDRHLPAAAGRCLQGSRRPLRRAQYPRERAGADGVAIRPDRARHVLQWRLARLRHFQSVSAEGSRHLRAAARRKARQPARSSSTTCSSTSAASCTRSIAIPAGSTRWRWISSSEPSCPALCRASTSLEFSASKAWMAGTSPAMTSEL